MLKPFDYYRPATKDEAVELLKQSNSKIMAGGTDLLVSMRNGAIKPEVIVDIKGIEELRGISIDNDVLRIGATVTINEIIDSNEIKEIFPVLVEAGSVLASYQVRNRATVAGNLCNASPAADMAPALLVLQAEAEVYGSRGLRQIPLKDFFAGVKKTNLAQDEVLTSIKVPIRSGKGKYIKKARIKGPDLSTVGVACFKEGGKLRIAVGACAPTPRLVELNVSAMTRKEIFETGKTKVMDVISPIDDVRASAEYRKALVEIFVERILEEIL